MAIEIERRFQVGAKFRREIRRVWVVFNHARNGNLVAQHFFDIEERLNSYTDFWNLIESATEKIEAFGKTGSVSGLKIIGPAESAEAALKLAREKFGMKPVLAAAKKRSEVSK